MTDQAKDTFTVEGYLREQADWWLQEIDLAPPDALPEMALIGRRICGHLRRLRESPLELLARLEPRVGVPPDDVIAGAVDEAQRALAELETLVDGDDADTDEIADAAADCFYDVLHALVVAADAEAEALRRHGRQLFNGAVGRAECFLPAVQYALAFDEAYAPRADMPQLFCRTVVRTLIDAETPSAVPMEEPQGRELLQPLSWYLQKPTTKQPGALAAKTRAPQGLTGTEFRQRLRASGVEWWYVSGASQALRLLVRGGRKTTLVVNVFDEEDADTALSCGMDGWEVRVRTAAMQPAREPEVLRSGTAELDLDLTSRIDPGEFCLEFRAPGGEWVECYGVPE